MTADKSVPAASGTVHVNRDKENGNTKLHIKVNNLALPSSLDPPASTYVVWVRPSNEDAVREGSIGVDENLDGDLRVVTVSKNFDVFITPEQSQAVASPSSREVLRAHITLD